MQEVGYNPNLTSLFSSNLKRDHVTILGVNFMVLVEIISSATTIPNEGEIWFKGMDLDIEHYKTLLKL